jgi:histidinol phosphatase-like PHP family hydrolase
MTLPNRDIAELLARRGDETDGPRQRAYRRSSAAAFVWTEEAASLVADDRPLTELRYVGERLAGRIKGWIESPPDVPEPPPSRRAFMTLTEAEALLEDRPEWRSELKADLQMHTVYSDGLETVATMASEVDRRGYEYIAITDHSSGQRVPRGMERDEVVSQWAEIDAANSEIASRGSRLRVLKSIEMNLMPDGSGALDANELVGFEIVMGSFHSKLRGDEDQTRRYLGAIQGGTVDMIGHPRGRRYNLRPGLNADWDAVFDAALENDVAFEINANPARQDLQVELLEVARDKGVRITIGTDAHSIPEFDFMDFGLALAIKAGVYRSRIVNYSSVDDLLAWVGSRRAGRKSE